MDKDPEPSISVTASTTPGNAKDPLRRAREVNVYKMAMVCLTEPFEGMSADVDQGGFVRSKVGRFT